MSTRLFLAAALVALGASAQAQTTPMRSGGYDASRPSWLPYTQNGYVGLNVGRPSYRTGCGSAAFACDDPSASLHLYAGGLFNPYFGLEVGYLHMGDADRGGGTTRAQGLNFSLLGRVPVGSMFSVFGKLGTTYGRTSTSTSASAGSGIATGKDSGWGESYGLGLSADLGSNWSAVLEWQRHRFHFAGNNKEAVRTTSLGVKYRF